MLRSPNRFPYSAITQRPDFSWPGGRRLAVYFALAVEHFPYGEAGLGVGFSPGIPHPATFNWAWREYGNRVGGWRIAELLKRRNVPASVLINTACYDHCSELIAALSADGHEIVGHGETNAIHLNGLPEDEQRGMIERVYAAIAEHEGKAPAGWMSPGANPTAITEDLVAAAGYRYTMDWPLDDQPVWFRTAAGLLLSLPYAHELNDIPVMVIHNGTPDDFADATIAAIDEQLAQSVRQPLVLPITIHTFVIGQPHRLAALRRILDHLETHRDRLWMATAGEIAEHYASVVPAPTEAR